MEIKPSIKIFLIPAIFFAVFLAFGNEARAADYYVATNGNDNNSGTDTQPWATFARAQDTSKSTYLQPGDTLMIKDGTYYQSLNVTVSGTQTSPITIKAENDGMAIIDGQNSLLPCMAISQSYITIEGLVCKNSNQSAFYIGYSNNIIIRRVSAANAGQTGNYQIFNIYSSDTVLLEDVASYGYGRSNYLLYGSTNVTLRRGWAYWEGHNGGGGGASFISVYDSANCTIENVIGLYKSGATYYGVMNGIGTAGRNIAVSNNKFYGNVVVGVGDIAYKSEGIEIASSNHAWKDNVAIGGYNIGFRHDSIANVSLTNMTWVGNSPTYQFYSVNTYAPASATIKNVFFSGGTNGLYITSGPTITHSYNDLHNITTDYHNTTAGTGEIDLNPAYDTATYGNGAYLMVPLALKGKGEGGTDIGAGILYRYQDGVLTNQPLWPWPMEDRIKNETGFSVTYESNGGIWKTLAGVYGEGDTTPPSAPTGLAVQ